MRRTGNPEHSETTAVLPWRAPAAVGAGERSRLGGATRVWREALAACGAFEWVALGYLGASGSLMFIFHRNLPGALAHPTAAAVAWLALQVGVALLIVALSWAASQRPSSTIVFVRHWYPQAFFLFCFEELHNLVHLIFPGWFDRWLVAFDDQLVGVHPTVWLEQFARPALNDFMQMAYISYFFYLATLAGILYARKEWRAYWAVMTSSVVAYTAGYVISILFPIESPYHSLAALQRGALTGGFFTSLIGVIEYFGRVHGAAFPSAHVSGSFVALWGAWRYQRWLFWVFLPFFLCMLVSTVYGRYHYIADVLGGLLVGAVGFYLGHRLIGREGALPEWEGTRELRNAAGLK